MATLTNSKQQYLRWKAQRSRTRKLFFSLNQYKCVHILEQSEKSMLVHNPRDSFRLHILKTKPYSSNSKSLFSFFVEILYNKTNGCLSGAVSLNQPWVSCPSLWSARYLESERDRIPLCTVALNHPDPKGFYKSHLCASEFVLETNSLQRL